MATGKATMVTAMAIKMLLPIPETTIMLKTATTPAKATAAAIGKATTVMVTATKMLRAIPKTTIMQKTAITSIKATAARL